MKSRLYGLAVVVIILDQITKWLANTRLNLHEPLAVMPSFNLTLMYNKGAAFSFLSSAGGWQRWFFTIVASVISVVLIVWISRLDRRERWLGIGLALVLGGAIGNLIDRVYLGYVIDFVQWYYNQFYWPAFNIADAAISAGTVILLFTSFFGDHSSPESDAGAAK